LKANIEKLDILMKKTREGDQKGKEAYR